MTMELQPKIRFLALLGHNLTIAARGVQIDNDDLFIKTKKLCALNEVLHTVTGQIMDMLDEDLNRYPDDVFIDGIFERAQQTNCEKDVIDAFAFSFRSNNTS